MSGMMALMCDINKCGMMALMCYIDKCDVRTYSYATYEYEVATISGLLQIIGLFCKRAL